MILDHIYTVKFVVGLFPWFIWDIYPSFSRILSQLSLLFPQTNPINKASKRRLTTYTLRIESKINYCRNTVPIKLTLPLGHCKSCYHKSRDIVTCNDCFNPFSVARFCCAAFLLCRVISFLSLYIRAKILAKIWQIDTYVGFRWWWSYFFHIPKPRKISFTKLVKIFRLLVQSAMPQVIA